MTTNALSLEAARKLRKGVMPHVPPPASPINTTVQIVLDAPADSFPEVVFTDPNRDGGEKIAPTNSYARTSIAGALTGYGWRVALEKGADGKWYTNILLPRQPTILIYHFELKDGTKIHEKRQFEGVIEPLFGVWDDKDFRIAVYDPAGDPPAWVRGQVMYQIFPDRFAQGDPSNLTKGAAKAFDHDVIYKKWDELPENPPKSRDFFGGDLRGVINKLDYIHELGITTIYFTPIFDSPTNHRYDANDYHKIDPRLGTEDDLRELIEKAAAKGVRVMLDGVFNHCSRDSIYYTEARKSRTSPYYRWFSFQEWPDKWLGWIGVATMPEFVECPEVEDFFFGDKGVAQHWLGVGTSGWRTDVTPWVTDEFWRRFRKAVRRDFPEAYLIAEDWGDASHRLLGDSFDATMNYRFDYTVGGWADGKLTPAELDDRLETLRRDTPPAQFQTQMNLLGSHDTIRLLTKLNGDKTKMKLAAAFQMTYPGVPMIYYGDETGIEGAFAEDSRRPYPWDNPDTDLVNYYKHIINTRHASTALKFGGLETVYIDEQGGYGILRRSDDDTVLALFNNSDAAITVTLPLNDLPVSGWSDLLHQVTPTVSNGQLTATLPAYGAAWLQAK